MTTVVTRSMIPLPLRLPFRLHYLDRDVHRVRDGVVYGRALLRLRDDRLDVLLRCIRVDLERHLDVVVPVADVAVDAEDAANVHLAFDLRLDGPQLDAAILRHGGNAGGQTAREADEHVLDRGDPVILRGEDLRVIRLERALGLVLLLLPESEETFDVRLTVRAVLPLAGRPPRELCRL